MNWQYKLAYPVFLIVIGIASMTVAVDSGWGQTYVSGTVLTADGKKTASGVVALEKGALHNNAFLAGGAIDADGEFKILLPSGGPWGLHVYSENYIYFPLQIQIKEGIDNDIPVILPVDGNRKDDPLVADIQFKKISDQVFQITMNVSDPNKNLGPQVVAVDTRRFKSYRLLPESGDLKDWKANFPEGKYTSPFIPVALKGEDLSAWLLVVADHQCSNGVILNGLNQSIFKPPVAHSEKLTCEVSGIWRSNFDKVYQFSQVSDGVFNGQQFEGNLIIDNMTRQGDAVSIGFRFEDENGTAKLKLVCRESSVVLKGTYQYPARSGDWMFTKLKNAKTAPKGSELFKANCSACHFSDRPDTKVGPGLSGLFKNPKLPDSGKPTSEKTVQNKIINGGSKMPPFKHLKENELKAIVEYLKSL